MRISDWSSDVCSSDLHGAIVTARFPPNQIGMALPSRSRCHAEADRLLQPTTLQQRLHARVLAAEVAVQGGEVDGVAAREDLVAEDLAVLAGQAAVLLDRKRTRLNSSH